MAHRHYICPVPEGIMRIAAVFVFLALVCASQAHFGSLLNAGKDAATNLLKTALDNINQAAEHLKSVFKSGQEKLSKLIENLQNAGENVLGRVEQSVNKIVENTENQVNKLTDEAESDGTDVSECKGFVDILRVTTKKVIKKAIFCVTDKVQQAKNITTDTIAHGNEAMQEIAGIRNKIEECSKDSTGILDRIGSASCVASASGKAAWVVSTKVPAVAKNVAEATQLVSTLQPSLTICTSTKAIGVLIEQSRNTVDNVKNCIAKKKEAEKNNDYEDDASDELTNLSYDMSWGPDTDLNGYVG